MLNLLILYLLLGTIWAWYGLNVCFYIRKIHTKWVIYQIISIFLNCILFPLGLIMNKFVFIIKPSSEFINQQNKLPKFQNKELKSFGVLIETLY
jgi:RsiW-degrading membrane proteinase PrsW (M82 family)